MLLLIITLSNIIEIKNREITANNNSSKNKNKNLISTKFPYQNPLGNLAAGIGKSMVGEAASNKFMYCFPKTWTEKPGKKKGPMRTLLGNLTKLLGALALGLSAFLKIFEPILGVICKNKDFIMKLIGTAMVRRRKYRVSESSSLRTFSKNYRTNLKNLNMTKWGLLSAIADAKKFALKKIEDAKNLVITKVFGPIFAPVKAKVQILIDKVKSLFMGGFLKKLFKCAENMRKTLYKFKPIFQGLFDKFTTMIKYSSGGAAKLILFFVDILLAQICSVKTFRRGLEMIVKGSATENRNERFYLTGRGLGLILKKYALTVIKV